MGALLTSRLHHVFLSTSALFFLVTLNSRLWPWLQGYDLEIKFVTLTSRSWPWNQGRDPDFKVTKKTKERWGGTRWCCREVPITHIRQVINYVFMRNSMLPKRKVREKWKVVWYVEGSDKHNINLFFFS